jgi:hypothetical protein
MSTNRYANAHNCTTPTNTTLTYSTVALSTLISEVSTGTVTKSPTAVSSTYGPFPANSDIGLEYSDYGYADKNLENKTYRGFELRSVGEELDQYSDSIDGFEYRIDCDYDPVSGTFTKTFVFIPINFPNPPAPGEVSPISRFGADDHVFEFPGNITDIDVKESAENAATRFFIVGNIPDLGNDISQPYSVASSVEAAGFFFGLLAYILASSFSSASASSSKSYFDFFFGFLTTFSTCSTSYSGGASVVSTYSIFSGIA